MLLAALLRGTMCWEAGAIRRLSGTCLAKGAFQFPLVGVPPYGKSIRFQAVRGSKPHQVVNGSSLNEPGSFIGRGSKLDFGWPEICGQKRLEHFHDQGGFAAPASSYH